MRLPFKGQYPLTQEFGVNPQYYSQFLVLYPDGTRKPMAGHNGLDFGCPHGTEVVAPHDGEVIEASFDASGYGNYIKIENAQMGSVLAHLDKIDVQVGFQVKEGDHLGFSDNTGYSTGNHLHWGWYTVPRDRNNGEAGFDDQTQVLLQNGIHVQLNEIPVVDTVPVQPVSGKLYTQEEYDAAMADRQKFWAERDEAIAKLDGLSKQYTDLQGKYATFVAAGYNTVDDVVKGTKLKDDTILALQKEVAQTRLNNGTLATMVADSEKQDHTATELGIAATDRLAELEQDMQEIAKVTGVDKPTRNKIVTQILNLADLADKFIRRVEQEQKDKQTVAKQPNKPGISGLVETLQLFKLEGR